MAKKFFTINAFYDYMVPLTPYDWRIARFMANNIIPRVQRKISSLQANSPFGDYRENSRLRFSRFA